MDYESVTPSYAIHNEVSIRGFFGAYSFLSNSHATPVEFEGIFYPSSENAYQAAKVAPNEREPFRTCTAAESKKLWHTRAVYVPDAWDTMKRNIMARVVFDKFLRNAESRELLMLTRDKLLEERNERLNVYWGTDKNGEGGNHLGKILMATRAYFQEEGFQNQ